jgi:hypothetical protein
MTVHIITNVARQVEGDYIFVQVEKAFSDKAKADEYLKSQVKYTTRQIDTPAGPVECLVERGLLEIEVEN